MIEETLQEILNELKQINGRLPAFLVTTETVSSAPVVQELVTGTGCEPPKLGTIAPVASGELKPVQDMSREELIAELTLAGEDVKSGAWDKKLRARAIELRSQGLASAPAPAPEPVVNEEPEVVVSFGEEEEEVEVIEIEDLEAPSEPAPEPEKVYESADVRTILMKHAAANGKEKTVAAIEQVTGKKFTRVDALDTADLNSVGAYFMEVAK